MLLDNVLLISDESIKSQGNIPFGMLSNLNVCIIYNKDEKYFTYCKCRYFSSTVGKHDLSYLEDHLSLIEDYVNLNENLDCEEERIRLYECIMRAFERLITASKLD